VRAARPSGSVANGLAEVYLRIVEDEPETVYSYLTEPRLDVKEAEGGELGFPYSFTAVSRLLGYSLLALQSPMRDQAWRNAASKRVGVWEVDFEEILRQIPSSVRKATPGRSLLDHGRASPRAH